MLEKAQRALALARAILVRGDYDFAASRAYYAAYYAVLALLRSRGISTSRHSGALSEFGRVFLKTGIFARELGKSLQRLFDDRQRGDYEPGVSVSERDAEQDIAAAERIVTSIETFMGESGLLPPEETSAAPKEG